MATIHLPPQLAVFAEGQRRLTVQALDLNAAFAELDKVAPMVRSQIVEPGGQVRPFVGLFVDEEQVLELESESGALPLSGTSQVQIVMSVAGG
ncbi:hypothetical protein ABIC83_002779 [Roseateles asaccharophilus]|uniref:hypothetical protein n=1 Tax=Roseateles asaccharophilus TaxID=582607 RepID=UPI003838802F